MKRQPSDRAFDSVLLEGLFTSHSHLARKAAALDSYKHEYRPTRTLGPEAKQRTWYLARTMWLQLRTGHMLDDGSWCMSRECATSFFWSSDTFNRLPVPLRGGKPSITTDKQDIKHAFCLEASGRGALMHSAHADQEDTPFKRLNSASGDTIESATVHGSS